MAEKVRVRRDRPSGVAWAIAAAAAMLFVYFATLSLPERDSEPASARITRTILIEPVEAAFVSLGAYPDALNARMAAAEFTRRGAAGVVIARGGEWLVLGAAYEDLAAAQLRAEALSARENLLATAFQIAAEGVRLRVTAPECTVNAIENAICTVRTQVEQLGAIADRLDRGQIDAVQARTLAAVARSEICRAAEVLSAAEGSEWLRSLCGGLNAAAASLDRIQEAESAAEISGRLRACQIQGLIAEIGMSGGEIG